MGYVSTIHYAVIINGYPSMFFAAGRGLRQACALSPFLFILAMDRLSLKIKKAMTNGVIEALKITSIVIVSHSVFVDEVSLTQMVFFIFNHKKKIGKATGLVQNEQKSIILYGSCNQDDIRYIKNCLGVNVESLDNGMKYLGYTLKPRCYKNVDWM